MFLFFQSPNAIKSIKVLWSIQLLWISLKKFQNEWFVKQTQEGGNGEEAPTTVSFYGIKIWFSGRRKADRCVLRKSSTAQFHEAKVRPLSQSHKTYYIGEESRSSYSNFWSRVTILEQLLINSEIFGVTRLLSKISVPRSNLVCFRAMISSE